MDTSEDYLERRYWPKREEYVKRDALKQGPPTFTTGGKLTQATPDWIFDQVTLLTKFSQLADLVMLEEWDGSFEASFNSNRVEYILRFLTQDSTTEQLHPLGTLAKDRADVDMKHVGFILASHFVMAKGLIHSSTVASLTATRRLIAAKLSTPQAMSNAQIDGIANVINSDGIADGINSEGMATRLYHFAMAVINHHGGVLPSTESTLAELPGLGSLSARAILQDCFGCSSGLVLDTYNLRMIVAFGWIHYEDAFFPDDGTKKQIGTKRTKLVKKWRGKDMIDIDFKVLEMDHFRESLESWVPVFMYPVFSKLTSLGSLMVTHNRNRRVDVFTIILNHLDKEMATMLSNFTDLCDYHAGFPMEVEEWSNRCVQGGQLEISVPEVVKTDEVGFVESQVCQYLFKQALTKKHASGRSLGIPLSHFHWVPNPCPTGPGPTPLLALRQDDDTIICYCAVCHQTKDVVCCSGCPEVYHPKCIPLGSDSRKSFDNNDIGDDWYCPDCNAVFEVNAGAALFSSAAASAVVATGGLKQGQHILAAYDLFLLPRYRDGFSNMEAVMHGEILEAPSKGNKNKWHVKWLDAFPTMDKVTEDMVIAYIPAKSKTSRHRMKEAAARWTKEDEDSDKTIN
jgi:hypothetical protein